MIHYIERLAVGDMHGFRKLIRRRSTRRQLKIKIEMFLFCVKSSPKQFTICNKAIHFIDNISNLLFLNKKPKPGLDEAIYFFELHNVLTAARQKILTPWNMKFNILFPFDIDTLHS